MLFYKRKKHVCKSDAAIPCFNNLTLREDESENKKSRFYVRHSHFEASQGPQVIGSAQDGERAAGAKAISGQDPGSRPMRGRVVNAQESENRQKSDKKGFEHYEIL